MFVLEGLQLTKKIHPSIEGILAFVEEEMADKEKKQEYFNRKFKHTKHVGVVQFQSLSPLKLVLAHEYDMNEISEFIKFSKHMFDPLFFSYNITNKQYRKVYGFTEDKEEQKAYKGTNNNSFSDYYINHKVLDKVLPAKLTLCVPIETSSQKSCLLEAFYELFNEKAWHFHQEGKKEAGYDFYLDFNSLMDLECISDIEKESFLQQLIEETGLKVKVSYASLKEKQQLNSFMHLIESICFQATEMKTKLSLEGKSISQLLEESVVLPFEAPTGEKPLLARTRHPSLLKENELPRISFAELILIRLLVVNINKQGMTPKSGFSFLIKEGNDPKTSIEKHVQVVADKTGNQFIPFIDIHNIQQEEAFKEKIQQRFFHYYGYEIEEEKALFKFYAHYHEALALYFQKHLNEKELIERKWRERAYRHVGKLLYDHVYPNITSRIANYHEKMKKIISTKQLVSLLFVLDVLHPHEKNRLERLSYMHEKINVNELIEKPHLTIEEVHFVLGAIAGYVSKSSRNYSSLIKTMMRQYRTKDVLRLINKRIESGVHEITYLPMVQKWMQKVYEHLSSLQGEKPMTNEEKFSYLTGLLGETKKEKKEEMIEHE